MIFFVAAMMFIDAEVLESAPMNIDSDESDAFVNVEDEEDINDDDDDDDDDDDVIDGHCSNDAIQAATWGGRGISDIGLVNFGHNGQVLEMSRTRSIHV